MVDLWTRLHPNSPVIPTAHTEYPKWVTVDGASVLVQSREEEEARLRDGPSEKSQLQLEAQALGIQVDRRWGVKKLRSVINGHR